MNDRGQRTERRALVAGLALLAGPLLVAESLYESRQAALWVQAACFAAALIWMAYMALPSLPIRRPALSRIIFHRAWAVVLAAVAVRYVSLAIFPPARQTGFEELDTGGNAYLLLRSLLLPLEFRFTAVAGALGLLGAPPSLAALRLGFQLAGYLSLVLLAVCLRSLNVGWLATSLVTITAAGLRWLVIAGGIADELFFGICATTALLWCLSQSDAPEGDAAFWAGAAGICAGVLAFEYTSFRVMVPMAGAWFVWQALRPPAGGAADRVRAPWLPLISFGVSFTLVALPMILDLAHQRVGSVLLEGFRRHGTERTTFLVSESLVSMKHYALALAGRPSAVGLFLAPVGEPILLPAVGWFFALSLAAGLLKPGHRLARLLALTVVLSVVVASVAARGAGLGRLSALLPLLLVLAGIFLEDLNRLIVRAARRIGPARAAASPAPRGLRLLMTAGYGLLAIYLTALNLAATLRMQADEQVRGEYANDDYVLCHHVGQASTPGQEVYVYAPDSGGACPEVAAARWLSDDKDLRVHSVDRLPDPDLIAPGTLVVVGVRGRALTAEELDGLFALDRARNSSPSVSRVVNIAGRVSTASVCVQCPPAAQP